MLNRFSWTLLFISFAQYCLGAQSIRLYYQDISTKETHPWGTIEYEQQIQSANFKEENLSQLKGQYCLGTKDLPNNDCFAYVEPGVKDILVYIDSLGEITGLGVIGTSKSAPQVQIKRIDAAPIPNYSPAVSPQNAKKSNKPATEKVVKKKIIKETDEEGNEVETVVEEEIEVEVDERTWIQKNWLYLVLPLVFFLLLGEEKK